MVKYLNGVRFVEYESLNKPMSGNENRIKIVDTFSKFKLQKITCCSDLEAFGVTLTDTMND